MIEIGRERSALLGIRTLASIAGNIAGLLVLIWLIRQILPLASYSATILTAAFALMFAHGILDTKTLSAGKLRAVSSILWNTTGTSILVIILIYVLGWIAGLQRDSLPSEFSAQVPNLLIAAIVTGIIAYVLGQAAPRFRGPVARGPAIKVSPDTGLDYGKVKLATKNDSMILPIRAQRGTVGAMVYGDVTATFDTPMGTVTGSIPGPLTTIGIPFRGEKADGDEISRITGETLSQLQDEADVDTTLPRGEIFSSPGGDIFPESFSPSRVRG